jgi:hypothetical protein
MMLPALAAAAVCAATPVHGEPLPQSGALSPVKWVQAAPHRAGIVGMLAAFDETIAGVPPHFALWAGGRAPGGGPNQKILWIVRNTGLDLSITIRGRELGGTATFRQQFTVVTDASPQPAKGAEYASVIVVPHSGCWRLDVSTGRAKGSLIVNAVAP